VLPFRRQRSLSRRIADSLTRSKRKPALRSAAAALDQKWARSWLACMARESFMNFVLNPIMGYYARRRATGREKLAAVKGPVILVANHASHLDTPVILSALPRSLRRRTAVAAAADYFYRNRVVASIVALIFNTVPIERKGGGGLSKNGSHLDNLLDQGWNLLLYPEGTRNRAAGGSSPSASPAPPTRCPPAACGPSACAASSASPPAIASRSPSATRSPPARTPPP
jgi:hypothetical protein